MFRRSYSLWAKSTTLSAEAQAAIRRLCIYRTTVSAQEAYWNQLVARAKAEFQRCKRKEGQIKKLVEKVRSGRSPVPMALQFDRTGAKFSLHQLTPKTGFAAFVAEQHERALQDRDKTWLDASVEGRLSLASTMWMGLPERRKRVYHAAAKRNLERQRAEARARRAAAKKKLEEVGGKRERDKKKRKPSVLKLSKSNLSGFSKFAMERLSDRLRIGDGTPVSKLLSDLERRWQRMSPQKQAAYD